MSIKILIRLLLSVTEMAGALQQKSVYLYIYFPASLGVRLAIWLVLTNGMWAEGVCITFRLLWICCAFPSSPSICPQANDIRSIVMQTRDGGACVPEFPIYKESFRDTPNCDVKGKGTSVGTRHWDFRAYLLLQQSLSYSDWYTTLLKYLPVTFHCI